MKINEQGFLSVLDYDPITGWFTWKSTIAKRAKVGCRAGTVRVHKDGKRYRAVTVFGQREFEHRLAFLFTVGHMPVGEVAHDNGDGTDNKFSNLSDVAHTENMKNYRMPTHNTSGVMGVNFHSPSGKWRSSIKVKGKRIYLGNFKNFSDAVEARKKAEIELGFHPNHGSIRPL